MDIKKARADFQLVKSRVNKFNFETKLASKVDGPAKLDYDIDYNISDTSSDEDNLIGVVEFFVTAKAKIKNNILFSVYHKMEGVFYGNPAVLDEKNFAFMLELNGVATLTHLSRAYILSATSLLGLNPPIRLPMININQLKKLKSKTDEDKGDN